MHSQATSCNIVQTYDQQRKGADQMGRQLQKLLKSRLAL
jgi:hypothetical protein